MEYEDFRITIMAKDRGAHRVLIESPAGSYGGTFINPIGKDELDEKLMERGLKLKSSKDASSENGLRGINPVKSTDVLDGIGDQLSKALFQEQILGAYAQSQGIVERRGYGLRIRIRIVPDIDEYAELQSLPWEFLFDATRRERIGLMDNRAIVRDPVTPTLVYPLEVEPPLKVLAVVSLPDNYSSLKLGRESTFLKTMSQLVPSIEVKFLERATIDALSDEMRDHEYHVFHFMGHGGYDSDSKRSVLIFKGEDGKGIPIDGDLLRYALSDSVRLVFLNACETARIPEADPFAAIPTELLLRKISAVLSMQFPITDSAAITFCENFYKCLVESRPVDQCTWNGRRKIFMGEGTRPEWGIPVLFMRSDDGMIFKMKQESQGN